MEDTALSTEVRAALGRRQQGVIMEEDSSDNSEEDDEAEEFVRSVYRDFLVVFPGGKAVSRPPSGSIGTTGPGVSSSTTAAAGSNNRSTAGTATSTATITAPDQQLLSISSPPPAKKPTRLSQAPASLRRKVRLFRGFKEWRRNGPNAPPPWETILGSLTSIYLDVKSILTLSCCSTKLWKQKYFVPCLNMDCFSAFTEPEIIRLLPVIKRTFTKSSLQHLNFSRCCFLTTAFCKSLTNKDNARLAASLRSLYFDFCFNMTDKSLEVLLNTPFPALERLSFRCARGRDLTGAPFTTCLSKARWPKLTQLICSCTQVALSYLDPVARFLAERALEQNTTPKLAIAGSLASASLIKRLGLEQLHRRFVEAIVLDASVPALEDAISMFEAAWIAAIDASEESQDATKSRVLNRMMRTRATPILVNAPCSMSVVCGSDGKEKSLWLLLGRRRRTRLLRERLRNCNCCGPTDEPPRTDDIGCRRKESSREATASNHIVASELSGHTDAVADETDGYLTSALCGNSSSNEVKYTRYCYPLQMAVRLSYVPLAQELIRRGAYVDAWSYSFTTPLYIACTNCGRKEEDDFDELDKKCCSQEFPQGQAASSGPPRPLEHDLSSPPPSPPLYIVHKCSCKCHVSEQEKFHELNDASCTEMVELLLSAGAPVDAPDAYNLKCPVNAAIKNDNAKLLQRLLKAGANINVRNLPAGVTPPSVKPPPAAGTVPGKRGGVNSGLTRLTYKSPLFRACELNARKCMEVLLNSGADPHWTDPFTGRSVTPVFLAYRRDPSTLKMFVKKGAGSSDETRWVLSEVLALAILQEDLENIKYLVDVYPDLLTRESSGMWSLPLHQAARLGRVTILETLLSLGADPDAQSIDGLTALHVAASEGNVTAVNALLSYGANPNVQDTTKKKSPLHSAVEENRKDVAQALLESGADASLVDNFGATPLMVAIASRHEKLAIYLVEVCSVKGGNWIAFLDMKDSQNRTALMYAIYYGQFKVAELLVDKGVMVRISDVFGATAEDLLKSKIDTLTTGSNTGFNKILRNLVGGGQPPASDDEGEELSNRPASEESVRKLNEKRRRAAKRLLKKLKLKAKKESPPPDNNTDQ